VYDMGSSEAPGLAPLLVEYDENGNLVAKYHHDGGGLMAMTRNNTSYWYPFEAIGTTRQLIDGQGQVLDAYAYLEAWRPLIEKIIDGLLGGFPGYALIGGICVQVCHAAYLKLINIINAFLRGGGNVGKP